MIRRGGLACALALALALPRPALPDGARTTLSTDLTGLYAPDGVALTAALVRHLDLPDGAGALLRGRFVEAGLTVGVNPGYGQAGLVLDVAPLAAAELRAQAEAYAFFGRAGSLLRFDTPGAPFGPGELERREGSERSGIGGRLLLAPTLRAEVGRLAAQVEGVAAIYAFPARDGWFYEPEFDTLLAHRDLLLQVRAALLAAPWRGAGGAALWSGPTVEWTRGQSAHLARARLGGALAWSGPGRLGAFRRPRLAALAGVNLQDRNRQGALFAVLTAGCDWDL